MVDAKRRKVRQFLMEEDRGSARTGKEIHLTEENAARLETCMYNWTIEKCKEDGYALNWKDPMFSRIYTQKAMSIRFNLRKNKELLTRLYDHSITFEWLVRANPIDLNPDVWKESIERAVEKQMRRLRTKDVENAPDGAFTCRRCKSKKTSYYQLQIRSSDEPMTSFVECLNCENRWKS